MRTSDRFRFWLAALVALGLVLAGGAVALADVDMYVNNAGGGHPNYPTLAAALDAADKTAYAGVAVTITIRSTGDGDGAGRVVNKDTTVLIETSVAGPITVGGNAGRIRGSDGAAVVITGANTGTVNNPNGSVSLQGNSSGDVTGLTITLSAGNASTSVSGTLTSTAGGSIVAANDVYIADCTISSLTSGNVYTSGNVTVTGNTSAVVSVESGTLSVPGGLGGTVRVKDGATLDATNHTGNTMTLEAYTGSTVLNLYMLTLDGMGGVVNPAILVTGMGVSGDGRLAFGPLPTPDRPGAAFLGWDVGGTLYQPGDSVVMNGNTTAYAQWDVGGPQLVSLTVANQSATIDDAAKTASVTVPYGTDLASLFVSAQAALGQSIFEGPAFTADASGGTFTVTVVDAGNVQHPYTVAVTVGNPSGDTSLTAFSLDSHAGTISGNAVTVVLPYGTDLTSLSAGWTTADPFAMVTPDPAGVLDWSSPVRLTVTASGGATVTYTVTAREDVAPGLYTLTLNANGGLDAWQNAYTYPAQASPTFDLASAGTPSHPLGYAFLGWQNTAGQLYVGGYTATAASETLIAAWDIPGRYVGGDGSGVSPTEAAASSGGHRIVGCKEWVNVRSGPGTNYEVVGRAFLGETVEPIQEKDGWVDCYYNGRSAHGWIRADFVD